MCNPEVYDTMVKESLPILLCHRSTKQEIQTYVRVAHIICDAFLRMPNCQFYRACKDVSEDTTQMIGCKKGKPLFNSADSPNLPILNLLINSLSLSPSLSFTFDPNHKTLFGLVISRLLYCG